MARDGRPSVRVGRIAALLAAAACGGCGGGGGSGGSFEPRVGLLSVTFPDPGDVNVEAEDFAPRDAPLLQQVVFTFDAPPDPDRVSSLTLPIRGSDGLFVPGRFDADGVTVTFTPVLPLRPIVAIDGGAWDTGGTSLRPGASYTVRVGPLTSSLVSRVASDLVSRYPDPIDGAGVLVGFRTTNDPTRFFGGLPPEEPKLVAVDPLDGSTGVSPNLYGDPDGLFAPRRTLQLEFDRPLDPGPANVSDSTFHLVDLDDRPSGFPAGLLLGVDVRLVRNEIDGAAVEVAPTGVLPFAHLLALEHESHLRGVSDGGAASGPTAVASTFTVASAPATVADLLVEDFDTNARQEDDPAEVGVGRIPADWNAQGSGVLQAAFAFRGDGVLGKFAPVSPPLGEVSVITLDTSQQSFPLPDGSTPEAPPGFVVHGGSFAFTEIDIPLRVLLRVIGNNPLVLTATGSVRIAGDVRIDGEPGTPENGYDSAVNSVPGGAAVAGGGRGGESHPVLFFPPDQASYATLVSPPFGGSGFGIDPADGAMKRIGGTGGQCGTLDHKNGSRGYSTEQEINCGDLLDDHDGEKAPGGGGGSMYRKGLSPQDAAGVELDGRGNVLPDGLGGWIFTDDFVLEGGLGGLHPFESDGNANNNFYGSRGQLRRLIGGQGGGGGASRSEAYYCGWWCDVDDDYANDAVCSNDDLLEPKYGSSVGDCRGGGGGGGGGAILIQALGPITIADKGLIDASGGAGKGGQMIGYSTVGGGGGGGAGGAIILQSGTGIVIEAGAMLDTQRGDGDSAADVGQFFDEGGDDGVAPGDGGFGGIGLIQLQVPAGEIPVVADPASIVPLASWVDPTNTLNPAEFTPTSVALSTWYDLGRAIARPPAGTNPVFAFRGLDVDGFVVTDSSGWVVDPAGTDVVCGYLGQIDPVTKQYRRGEEPRADFIPPNATVRLEFQGANAVVEGSKEVDPATITSWSPTPSVANGMQFLRWRITFDLTADGSTLAPLVRRPVVLGLGVRADF